MLGSAHMYSKSGNGQRRRIDVPMKSDIDTLIKENEREKKMNSLANKYFNKIVKSVIKAITNDKNKIYFYYTYYDFVNNGLGKPHGFLNEFMSEMSYEYSKYVTKDCHGNVMTFKTLFGQNFKWDLKGKDMMIISW
tara:strand:- start:6623 stop:7030 length:408 start_codon:yes stop_codon:yes gene_type:complete